MPAKMPTRVSAASRTASVAVEAAHVGIALLAGFGAAPAASSTTTTAIPIRVLTCRSSNIV
jgi:hypothetical protein